MVDESFDYVGSYVADHRHLPFYDESKSGRRFQGDAIWQEPCKNAGTEYKESYFC